ncbi:MAG: HAD family phosphatase [Chitinophagaceae bacterium]|nr:HAD family phosphatase [Chitinophagaceae bacterium]
MKKGVRHIIFDLGGVLLNIDYKLTEDAFVKLGMTNFFELYSQLKQTSLFDDFEIGAISTQEFINELRKVSGLNVSDKEITDAWNAMLLDFPLRRLQILQQLRIYYDLILLSNTNEIHEAAFNKILLSSHSIPNIGTFFDRVYLSHRIGMRKPDVAAFERIIEENGLQKEHTLFIDDSPQHVEGAEKAGIQSIWLQNGMTIEKDIFKNKEV